MLNFSGISAANGWLITALGVSVVFSGLASLAGVIYLLPRVLEWWRSRAEVISGERLKDLFRRSETGHAATLDDETFPAGELGDAETALRLITARLGEPFRLPRLLEVVEQRGLARPHSTVNRFLLAGAMVGGPDGLFRWARKNGGKELSASRGRQA